MATLVPGRIRAKIEVGVLPPPVPFPYRVTVGHGTGRICDACGESISNSQIECETAPPLMRLHETCLAEWPRLQAERKAK